MKDRHQDLGCTRSMRKRVLTWTVLLCHLLFVCGCSSTERASVSEDQLSVGEDTKILRVILKTGEIIEFNSDGGRYVEERLPDKLYRAIVGTTVDSNAVEISPEKTVDIDVEIKSANVAGTVLLVTAAVVVAAGTTILILFSIGMSQH